MFREVNNLSPYLSTGTRSRPLCHPGALWSLVAAPCLETLSLTAPVNLSPSSTVLKISAISLHPLQGIATYDLPNPTLFPGTALPMGGPGGCPSGLLWGPLEGSSGKTTPHPTSLPGMPALPAGFCFLESRTKEQESQHLEVVLICSTASHSSRVFPCLRGEISPQFSFFFIL